ncbi:MAG TPA: HupE/UreJ family protein [Candidatus Acidoferrum sp.]|nr:HupE/UreJ family protein [Candidatus Acidoferrum sp.]
MKLRLIAVTAVVLSLGIGVSAHRLDEYLQATIFSVDKDSVHGSMRLIPGVAVAARVIADIDADGDGVVSVTEKQAYAERVLAGLTLKVDGERLSPRLTSVSFPGIAEMKEGLGEIQIEFDADLPPGGEKRKLFFENHNEAGFAVYLVNCLVPSDKNIRVVAQKRNENQSLYELEYSVAGGGSAQSTWKSLPGVVGFTSIFRLGMRHIAEGTDHLLFLLALLLPAPLIVVGARWGGFAGTQHSLLQILKVVTAFTLGHSITLALAAWGVMRMPSRPIEVLIAISIFVSAAHAVRPLFPGREAVVAAFFGLIHGLAFATTLGELGLDRWERMMSILSFNLGIETMQLLVVAAVLPSLVLASRTRAYPALRIAGAVFAGLASLGWIGERILGWRNPMEGLVNGVARHGIWVAGSLFLVSVACWMSGGSVVRSVGDAKTHGVLVLSR